MDADLFRAGMRRLTAAVSIVSAHGDEGPAGATVSSVTSLCADPQSLLFCLNRASTMHQVIAGTRYFAINVLHHSQADLAAAFADPRQRAQRFEQGRWELGDKRAPYLSDAQVVFLCERNQLIDFGTHAICIGNVLDVFLRADFDPLVYAEGAMHRIAQPSQDAVAP